MGSVNLSQSYGSMYQVNATASWTTGPTVTINITYNSNGDGWRIRGRNPDTTEYLVCSGGTWTGTFDAIDGKDYVFQVYFGVTGSYSDGHVFTVNFDGSDSGGDDGGGGGSISTPRTLHIYDTGVANITVERTWSNYGSYSTVDGGAVYLSDGDIIWYDGDVFVINAEPLEGYEIDYYDLEGEQLPFGTYNLTFANQQKTRLKPLYDDDIHVYATGSSVSTTRIYNKNSSNWDLYTLYIYDKNNSSWDRYSPYIYNVKDSNWDRYS